jgi:hypothetical protein
MAGRCRAAHTRTEPGPSTFPPAVVAVIFATADARTQAPNKPPASWVLVQRPGELPQGAIPVGREADGTPLFAARAFHEGGLHVGSAHFFSLHARHAGC